jgi:hypothetical protein
MSMPRPTLLSGTASKGSNNHHDFVSLYPYFTFNNQWIKSHSVHWLRMPRVRARSAAIMLLPIPLPVVRADDPQAPVSFFNFQLGNCLVEIAALTTFIGSHATSLLTLGNRGAVGLPWAAISAFGGLSIVKACVTGACPGWLQHVLGVRNEVSDQALGMSLDLDRTFGGVTNARKNMEEAIGIVCKNGTVSVTSDPSLCTKADD